MHSRRFSLSTPGPATRREIERRQWPRLLHPLWDGLVGVFYPGIAPEALFAGPDTVTAYDVSGYGNDGTLTGGPTRVAARRPAGRKGPARFVVTRFIGSGQREAIGNRVHAVTTNDP